MSLSHWSPLKTFLKRGLRTGFMALGMTALVTACQTTNGPSQANLPKKAAASSSIDNGPERMTPLSFNEMMTLMKGRSILAPNQNIVDGMARAILYVREDGNNRAYRYFPESASSRNYEVGHIKKEVYRGKVTVDGITHKRVEMFCLEDDLLRRARLCQSIYRKGNAFFYSGTEDGRLQVFDGMDAFVGPAVEQAVKDDNEVFLRVLAGDLGKYRPDLKSRHREVLLEQARKARAAMEAERARRASAARKAQAAKQQREAECQRDYGTSCAAAGGRLIMGVLGAGLRKMGMDGSSSAGQYSAPAEEDRPAPTDQSTATPKGVVDIRRSGPWTIVECADGSERKTHHDSYGTCQAYDTVVGSRDCAWAIQKAKDACN